MPICVYYVYPAINSNTTGATNGSGPASSLPVFSRNHADQSGVVCVVFS